MKKKSAVKPKVGMFVRVKEKRYRHIVYDGVVTESFNDMIQIFGTGYKELGFHEFDLDEINIIPVEKEKVRFLIDQDIRMGESAVLKAETKFKEIQNQNKEANELRNKFFGASQ